MFRSTKCAADSSSYYFEVECFNSLGAVTKDSGHQLVDYLSIYNLLNAITIHQKIREYAVYIRLCRLFPCLYQYNNPSPWSKMFEVYLKMYIEMVIHKLTDGKMPTVEIKVEREEQEVDSSDVDVEIDE